MKTRRELTCIGCPMGCQLTVELEDGKITGVEGYTCAKGRNYAAEECTHPSRTVTSTVPVEGGALKLLPVKTAGEIPKDLILECIRELRGLSVRAPVDAGDIVLKNVGGTGVDVIGVKSVPQAAKTLEKRLEC